MRYDGLERLTSFERHLVSNGASISNEAFTFDPASNVAARTGPTASYSYDAANRVTSDGARAFVWNGADRLTNRGSGTFVYDSLGRLTSSTVSGVARTYTYNGDGLLRSRSQGSTTTTLLYDPTTSAAQLLVAGTERLVYGVGPLYRVHANGSYDTFVRDGVGSVRVEVSGIGAITNIFDYSAYGKLGTSTPPLLGFAGELADPSGLIYLRTRWYDPVVGRFMSRDTLAGNLRSPNTFNGFGYAAGSPAVLVDPLGLDPQRSNWAYTVAGIFADLDSTNPFRKVTAYVTVVAGGFAIAGVSIVAASGVIAAGGAVWPAGTTAGGAAIEQVQMWWLVQRIAAAAAASAYVIGETQELVNRAAAGIGGVTMPYIANAALHASMTIRVINAVMDRGGLIIKIGLDPDKLQRGEFYAIEMIQIAERNYQYVLELLP